MKSYAILLSALMVMACANQNELGYTGGPAGGTVGANYGNPDYPDGAISGAGTAGYGNTANIAGGAGGAGAGNITYFNQTIGDTVLFPVDQSYLTPGAKSILDAQARWLLESPRNVLIEGHADEQGTREYNLALGARRAASVRDYLVQKGVPYSRIEVITYGKERPLAICSDESCWAKNRRAVTVVK